MSMLILCLFCMCNLRLLPYPPICASVGTCSVATVSSNAMHLHHISIRNLANAYVWLICRLEQSRGCERRACVVLARQRLSRRNEHNVRSTQRPLGTHKLVNITEKFLREMLDPTRPRHFQKCSLLPRPTLPWTRVVSTTTGLRLQRATTRLCERGRVVAMSPPSTTTLLPRCVNALNGVIPVSGTGSRQMNERRFAKWRLKQGRPDRRTTNQAARAA